MELLASVIKDQPIAFWPLDDDQNATAYDKGPRRLNGTYSTRTTGRGVVDGTLKSLRSGSVSRADSDSFKITDEITIELWVRPFSTSTGTPGISKGTDYQLYASGGLAVFRINNAVLATASLTTDKTNHVVASYSKYSGYRVFVNGVIENSGDPVGDIATSTSAVSITADGKSDVGYVAIYPFLLSDSAIATHFEQGSEQESVVEAMIADGTTLVSAGVMAPGQYVYHDERYSGVEGGSFHNTKVSDSGSLVMDKGANALTSATQNKQWFTKPFSNNHLEAYPTTEAQGLAFFEDAIATITRAIHTVDWTRTGVSVNSTYSVSYPDGTTANSWHLVESDSLASTDHYVESVASVNVKTVYFLAKPTGNRRYFRVDIGGSVSRFYLSGVGTIVDAGGTADIQALSNGWYFFWINLNVATTTTIKFGAITSSTGSFNYVGDDANGGFAIGTVGVSETEMIIPVRSSSSPNPSIIRIYADTKDYIYSDRGYFECRIRRAPLSDGPGRIAYIFNCGDDDDNRFKFYIEDTTLKFEISNMAESVSIESPSGTVVAGEKYHIAVSWNIDDSATLYVNGTAVATAELSLEEGPILRSYISLFDSDKNAGNYINAWVRDFKFSKRFYSDTDVNDSYLSTTIDIDDTLFRNFADAGTNDIAPLEVAYRELSIDINELSSVAESKISWGANLSRAVVKYSTDGSTYYEATNGGALTNATTGEFLTLRQILHGVDSNMADLQVSIGQASAEVVNLSSNQNATSVGHAAVEPKSLGLVKDFYPALYTKDSYVSVEQPFYDAVALGKFAISVWFKPEVGTGAVLSIINSLGTDDLEQVYVDGSFDELNAVGSAMTVAPFWPITYNEWHHLYIEYDTGANSQTFYFDEFSPSTTELSALSSTTPLRVGDSLNKANLDGQIGAFAIFDKHLTTEQRKQQYQIGMAGRAIAQVEDSGTTAAVTEGLNPFSAYRYRYQTLKA